MALPTVRSTFVKSNGLKCWLTNHFASNNGGRYAPVAIQVATMRATYGEKYPYPKAWPYEQKKLNFLTELFDNSKSRLNENSKVIVVEGNVGCGKHDFAEKIAKGFDLKFFNTIHDDDIFVDERSGYDRRNVDEILPESAQAYDLRKFLHDSQPQRGTTGRLQWQYFVKQTVKYCEALLHVFSTGQGVVLVRSPYSDEIFANALRKMGWITPKYTPWYKEVQADILCMLVKPHLTIYLDAPVKTCMDAIKKRKDPREGKNLNEAYMQAIEGSYKGGWLNQQRESQEVMEIDWTGEASDMDMDVIIEEIQRLKLEREDAEDTRFSEWQFMTEDDLGYYRKAYADKPTVYNWFKRPAPWHLPEVMGSQADLELINRYVWEHPALKYEPGCAKELGNNPLLKL